MFDFIFLGTICDLVTAVRCTHVNFDSLSVFHCANTFTVAIVQTNVRKRKREEGHGQGDRVLDMAMADKFTQACILLSILITIIEGIEPNAFEHICSGIDCKLIWQ